MPVKETNQFAITRYATLEDDPGFRVTIDKVGSRFRLSYKDIRFSENKIVFTQWWETQGAADQYFELYKRTKEGRENANNSNRQGQLV